MIKALLRTSLRLLVLCLVVVYTLKLSLEYQKRKASIINNLTEMNILIETSRFISSLKISF